MVHLLMLHFLRLKLKLKLRHRPNATLCCPLHLFCLPLGYVQRPLQLMDLFFSIVSKAGVVPRARRLHFNDAMDELHRRMHRLELERAMLDAKQNEAFLQSVAAHEHKRMVRECVHPLLGCSADAPLRTSGVAHKYRVQVGRFLLGSAHLQADPFAAKQKSVQQAKLATRRLRSQLQKRPSSRASMGTSLILAKATLSLIRGTEDVNLGWDGSSRTASLLCFDELQVQ